MDKLSNRLLVGELKRYYPQLNAYTKVCKTDVERIFTTRTDVNVRVVTPVMGNYFERVFDAVLNRKPKTVEVDAGYYTDVTEWWEITFQSPQDLRYRYLRVAYDRRLDTLYLHTKFYNDIDLTILR